MQTIKRCGTFFHQCSAASVALALLAANVVHAAEPSVLLDGFQLQQIAKEPDVATPIGVAFDRHGRLLVVESHTHKRTDDYEGPAGDRVLMWTDRDADGVVDHRSVFAEGFHHAMNVAVRDDGAVYLVTRSAVHVLRDTDDDGRADEDEQIVRLETDEVYPHNGLSGIAFDERGRMYLGLGENFGGQYRLVGSDDRAIEDAGGSGTVFYCDQDGANLRHYAVGFWNPFSLCFAGGRLFCVDNDPDSSPPCRLIDVMYGGDYGHRWEYGRAGVHPLQAWDGELPGTLPMVCGTGEAPTAVLFHRGWLWVTSWGDHRIERYALKPRDDGSYSAVREVVVQGDPDFRPTGMAVAPDGSLYFSDWVDRSYPVHGKGRIWRLAVGDAQNNDVPALDAAPTFGARLRDRNANTDASERLSTRLECDRWRGIQHSAAKRVATIERVAPAALQSVAVDRLYAVRWIAENRVASLRDQVAELLNGEIPDERYFLAVIGAIEWLDGDGKPRNSGISNALLTRELRNPARSPELKTIALRLASPQNDWLSIDRLREFLASDYLPLRLEAVRSLAARSDGDRFALLAEIAGDAARNPMLRAEAISGLAAAAGQQRRLLEQLADANNATVAREASRVLRLSGLREAASEERPQADDAEAWNRLLSPERGGDAEAGRRLFFSTVGARCGVCHQHGGRGGRVGPDLTLIGRQQSRERIIASILRPSEDVAPRFQPWTLLTDEGRTLTGLKMPQGGDSGSETFADAEGRLFTLGSHQIEVRRASDQSIMPAGLETTVSLADLRDLIAFLAAEQ